jgi:hypothetical protein
VSDLSGATLSGADLAFADLSGADLSGSNVSGTELFGAAYDEFTIFPSGNTFDNPPSGLPNDTAPWSAGMIPAPEPSFGLMLLFGTVGLAGLAAVKGGA